MTEIKIKVGNGDVGLGSFEGYVAMYALPKGDIGRTEKLSSVKSIVVIPGGEQMLDDIKRACEKRTSVVINKTIIIDFTECKEDSAEIIYKSVEKLRKELLENE